MIRTIVAIALAIHGLIHVMGFAKAFGYAELPQLTQPISRGTGLLWLAASGLVVSAAVALVAWPQAAWMVGAAALVLSQALIVSAWRDAWVGTFANVVLLIAVSYGWFTVGPRSFRAQFERDAAAGLARQSAAAVVTDQDLAALPAPLQRYLRTVGVVGQPKVRTYRLRFTGRIRSAPDAAWMPFEAEQLSFADRPTRLFLMRARMWGVPIEVFHRLIDGHATMQVKIAGAIPIVDASGDVMDQSETVTLFNDMCLLAPATLLGAPISWEPVDQATVRARFTHGDHAITATLVFGGDGLLASFVSDDRSRSSPDGKTFARLRFSTPVRDYRAFGVVRLAAHGEARWLLPEGEFTYGEFDLQEVAYNVARN